MYLVVITDKQTNQLRIYTNEMFSTLKEAEDYGKRSKLKKKMAGKPLNLIINILEMTTLTNNFSLEEMIQSQTALRNNLDNTPNESQIENLKGLCENILQPLRDYYQSPIKVTSGFRSEKLATLIGSKPTSQHCKGEAADFEIPGYDNKEVASHIKNNFDYDQLILEYYDESDKNSGWIHCSFKSSDNRKQNLIKDKSGYKEWL